MPGLRVRMPAGISRRMAKAACGYPPTMSVLRPKRPLDKLGFEMKIIIQREVPLKLEALIGIVE